MNGTAEDQLRAGTYSLLAGLLRESPNQQLLEILKKIEADPGHDQGDIAEGWAILKLSALQADPERLDEEFTNLFIGIGRGEIIPYGSWYLTGFLMEKPLSYLRQDLQKLGFERQESTHEPEDHVAALCEVMAMIIGRGQEQETFFRAHIEPWMEKFFGDLEQAESACFYKSVGQFGKAFMQLEKTYFDMQL